MSLYIAGRGLACALGASLPEAIARLHTPPVPPALIQLADHADDIRWPYFQIPLENAKRIDWHARARALAQRAVAQAGIATRTDKQGALFIATSSFDIGALENGAAFLPDNHAFSERIAEWLDWQGQVYTVATACTSALNAIRSAGALLNADIMESACVLGVELANLFSVRGFGALQLLTQHAPRPWCVERDGLVLGEAVAALRLTRAPVPGHARWRIVGCENIVDGHAPTAASKPALIALYRSLLQNAGITPTQIGCIKLHAAGSRENDAVEAAALADLFAPSIPRITFKHLLGHTLGAAGAAEIALLTACLEHNVCPPLPDGTPDTTLGASLATQMPALPTSARYVLATLLGFGGGHAAVLLEDTAARK